MTDLPLSFALLVKVYPCGYMDPKMIISTCVLTEQFCKFEVQHLKEYTLGTTSL